MNEDKTIKPNDPADFTPSLGNYKSLQPFRYWCQKVLPLVYDDSLSYYELLCKVVDYLNKTMEDVETLHGDVTGLHEAYVKLQGYVNEYFNNLDVQIEINNKLDTMASDGSLLEVIKPTISSLTISEIEKWLNEHITNPANPPIDTSLSISGASADARAVGNRLSEIKWDNTLLKEDLKSIIHLPIEYWTEGNIDVPITNEWSNTQVKCEVDLSNMVGNTLKVSVGAISDSIDSHKCFINLLDIDDNNISDGHVLRNTFINNIIPLNGGYVEFDISSLRNKVKYIKIQAQAYSGTTPTISGTVTYYNISARATSDKTDFIGEINESNLSDELKNKLNIFDNRGYIVKNIGNMVANTTINIAANDIKKNKAFIVNARINSFTDKITIGHGIDVYGGAFAEITPTTLNVYNYNTQSNLVKTVPHGLTILNDIYIEITNFVSKYGFYATIKIVSQGKTYTQTEKFDFPWIGCNGNIFIKTGNNTSLSDCKVSWSCKDLLTNIHAFGDSYFDFWNPKMADLGYSDKFLFDGFGGRKTLQAIAPFNFCLEHGIPKYVLWCLGMNDPDIDSVNEDWLSGFNTVTSTCKDKAVTPIFSTIPNTPINNNSYKNAYIKSSGYRYVDIAHYVGADAPGSNWYDGLLSQDKIHPTDKGAYIIAQNIITDLADILFS